MVLRQQVVDGRLDLVTVRAADVEEFDDGDRAVSVAGQRIAAIIRQFRPRGQDRVVRGLLLRPLVGSLQRAERVA